MRTFPHWKPCTVPGEREAVSHRVDHYLLTGAEVLEGPNEWAGRHIPIIPVIGDEIRLETECVRKSITTGGLPRLK